MIKKFSKINNLAVFKDFKWDNSVLDSQDNRPLEFKTINIIYGRNYSGKTTLSRIVRSLETGQISPKYDNPLFELEFRDTSTITQADIINHDKIVRVFNEDFIRENLRFIHNPDEHIESFAILGADNNKIEQEIEGIKIKLGSKEEGKESELCLELINKENIYNSTLTSLKSEKEKLDEALTKKANDRTIGIKYKFNVPTYNKVKLEEDIKLILQPTYSPLSEEDKLREQKLIDERAKDEITNPQISPLSYSNICTEASELLSRKIASSNKINELLEDVALNEWVKSGLQLHNENKEICAFCGNKVSDIRWGQLFAHFDEESKKLDEAINLLIQKIEKEEKKVAGNLKIEKDKFYTSFHDRLDKLALSYNELSEQYKNKLSFLRENLSERKNKITVPIICDTPIDDVSSKLNQLTNDYIKICSESNENSDNLKDSQQEAQKRLLFAEVYEFCQTISYEAWKSKIKKLEEHAIESKDELKNIEDKVQQLENEIEGKKRLLQDEEKGALKVNEYLNHFCGHQYLTLQTKTNSNNGTSRTHFQIIRNGTIAYHLSEGECRLIAFCYFLAKLKDVETDGKKPIIWIDDPISSLDDNHIFFIFSLISSEIIDNEKYEQLFVSTHNLSFLKYLKRIAFKDPRKQRQYFIIKRSAEESTISAMPKYMKDHATEFNHLFHEIYKCSQIDEVDDASYSACYNFPNNARKFIDIYLFFKYPNVKEGDGNGANEKLLKIFNDNIPAILTNRITNEYSHLSSIERSQLPYAIPEIKHAAIAIIKMLKKNDHEQYEALLDSVGEQLQSPLV